MLIFSAKRSESLDGLFSFLLFFFCFYMEVNKDVGDRVQKIRESFASLLSPQRGESRRGRFCDVAFLKIKIQNSKLQ